MAVDWKDVAQRLENTASSSGDSLLDAGQKATLHQLALRLRSGQRSALLADEVGMGKTRIAAALIEAVRLSGGRSAIVIPGGLGAQWQAELRQFNPDDKTLLPLRSYQGFIEGFLRDDDWDRQSQRDRLRDRRLQRDLPAKTWADEKILMISHGFATMRFPRKAEGPHLGWKRELLPTVARMVEGRRRYLKGRDGVQHVQATHRAAQVIADAIIAHRLPCNLAGDQRWLPGDQYRDRILPLIGYGLGQFDLIIIDEAHKSRGQDSSLSRILGPVTWESDKPFRLGMTATPIELYSGEWIDTLARIDGRDDKADTSHLEALRSSIDTYCEITARLRTEELDQELVDNFRAAAQKFHETLAPYVLRRDKRDDREYAAFLDIHDDYRKVEDLSISPETHADCFTRDWLRRFCAAEALSLFPQNDPRIKRMRLSIAQGHSLDAVANRLVSDSPDEDAEIVQATETPNGPTMQSDRATFWLDALGGNTPDIYDHPALLAATRQIESHVTAGEKVLVFGRYIKPLDALTRFLDARAMLRALMDGNRWPARTIPEASRPAIIAALRDPEFSKRFPNIDDVSLLLTERYDIWRKQRRIELDRLHREIDALTHNEDPQRQASPASSPTDAKDLLSQLLGRAASESDLREDSAHLFEALEARRTNPEADWTGTEIVTTFSELLAELVPDEDSDAASTDTLRERLHHHLQEFSGREGSVARLMYGATSPQARRNLQAAFNRRTSNPKVLLAQSRVGREGLNLHEECRRVILLHAEWNPAIVEQQIGRVDRKNSRWLKDYRAGVTDGDDAPRIHIHPVVVRGTYDDHNWQVLKSRWSQLRAQLHGDVLPHLGKSQIDDPARQALIEQVRSATPGFSPLRPRE